MLGRSTQAEGPWTTEEGTGERTLPEDLQEAIDTPEIKVRARTLKEAMSKARRKVGKDYTVVNGLWLRSIKARFGKKLYNVLYTKRS